MFFTRSIRRKMVVGLALVWLMLMTLAFSGISGLLSYRNVVNDLDFSINKAARRAELVAAIGLLFEPLLLDAHENRRVEFNPQNAPRVDSNPRYDRRAALFQQHQFQERLEVAAERVLDFRRKLDQMPPSAAMFGQRPVMEALLGDIERRLRRLRMLEKSLTDERHRNAALREMFEEVARMHTLAQRVPDPQEGLNQTLQQARQVYVSRFWVVSVVSAVVVVLFCGLVRYGYLWIFAPIRKLHRGARRVAQGDFDYRIVPDSHDEMAELAEAFNQMTARFQEITQDLDRQVHERSKQLVRSERLAGVGFLSAGVAHEINNPLSAIVMASESLQGRLAELLTEHVAEAASFGEQARGGFKTPSPGGGEGWGEPSPLPLSQGERGVATVPSSLPHAEEAAVVRRYLDMIQREAFRCREITARLLDFARGQEASRSRNDLTAIISEVLAMIGHMSKFRDRRIVFTRTEPCYLEINGPEIKQVVLNLVANALESLERDGTLRIEIMEQTDHVVTTFEDDGCGMTPDVVENLFEPFFTRKKTGKGTGLGLSISHRIVTEHGGTIEAASAGPGQGSTFRVHLPRRAIQQNAA